MTMDINCPVIFELLCSPLFKLNFSKVKVFIQSDIIYLELWNELFAFLKGKKRTREQTKEVYFTFALCVHVLQSVLLFLTLVVTR